jgi:hypothetical protein
VGVRLLDNQISRHFAQARWAAAIDSVADMASSTSLGMAAGIPSPNDFAGVQPRCVTVRGNDKAQPAG